MCGIAGLIGAPGAAVDVDVLARMADAVAHRGPDAGTTWTGAGRFRHVGLAHRRLSVLDHEGGRQPMRRDDVTVVFNGQIYNHLALRKELQALGHTFTTDHSDTEVLVHGMRAWGHDPAAFLGRLSGMFAFAIVDERRGRLLLARDPMGKKPLYVALPSFFSASSSAWPARLGFASELAALERAPGARCAVDVQALARFFAFDFVPGPDCIYKGALKLPPGCFLDLPLSGTDDKDDDDGGSNAFADAAARIARYTDLRFGGSEIDDKPAALRAVIEEAVATRMVADVPVGIFLSGGIDSSLVAALAARRSPKVETFSISFRERSFDESSHARTVARHIGSLHHEQLLDEHALLDVLPMLGRHLSEPFADHSVIPTYLLARFARERVTVALGGDGGDELFLGYPTFKVERVRAGLGATVDALSPVLPPLLSAAARLPVSHDDMALDFKVQRTLDGVAEPRPLRRHQRFLTGATDARLRQLLSASARTHLPSADLLAPLDALEDAAGRGGARDVFDVLTYGYCKTYLAAGVMQKVDRATMAVGLEARAPLLDRRVVELALSLPTSDKLAIGPRGITTKAVLKRAARGLLPDEIIDRPKKGFGMPVASWLCGPLRPLVGDLLSPAALKDDGLLDVAGVGALVDEHLQRRRNHRKTLWALLMYRLWRTRPRA